MSQASRKLEAGAWVVTDYNGPGPMARVQIVDVDRERKNGHSQSGVMFRVFPLLKHGTPESWYCSDWFEPSHPMPPNVQIEPPRAAKE